MCHKKLNYCSAVVLRTIIITISTTTRPRLDIVFCRDYRSLCNSFYSDVAFPPGAQQCCGDRNKHGSGNFPNVMCHKKLNYCSAVILRTIIITISTTTRPRLHIVFCRDYRSLCNSFYSGLAFPPGSQQCCGDRNKHGSGNFPDVICYKKLHY
ncbi:jg11190 [Pararge aegeria aegeria]|uniref:Jg11190 protein n=1 Tax=Pararge aegeria aegeria TaxID=348720 RepID=A0A8S4RM46_9NEOP|nr:jg11190 [Pararge aegeria aegeria]